MQKTFNVTGSCDQDEHYMLPALERCKGLLQQVDWGHYFVIQAAPQSGKTTLLLELARQLNEAGDYYALYCSVGTVQGIVEAKEGISAIIKVMENQIKSHKTLNKYPFAEQVNEDDYYMALMEALAYFCQELDKPLVILFDDMDCLSGGTLNSFLPQIRSGHNSRSHIPFAHSIVFAGIRRKIRYDETHQEAETRRGSPFNIVSETFSLQNFTLEEMSNLYAQHTEQTGQVFSKAVIETIYDNTWGQPWLVNAIAKEIVVKMLDKDVSKTINPEQVEPAIQTLIQRRDSHIDGLMKRLKEPRVQRIIEPVIMGERKGYGLLDDDYQYVLDLGLLREADRRMVLSNPIYREVINRALKGERGKD
jgi:hypothetical protein